MPSYSEHQAAQIAELNRRIADLDKKLDKVPADAQGEYIRLQTLIRYYRIGIEVVKALQIVTKP